MLKMGKRMRSSCLFPTVDIVLVKGYFIFFNFTLQIDDICIMHSTCL